MKIYVVYFRTMQDSPEVERTKKPGTKTMAAVTGRRRAFKNVSRGMVASSRETKSLW